MDKFQLKVTSALSNEAFGKLSAIMNNRVYQENNVFVREGQKNNREYIIKKGYCRSFLLNRSGKEITLAFYKEGDVLPPHITRSRDQVSLVNLQALSPMQTVEFDATEFLELMINNLEIRDFGNSLLKDELLRKTKKEIDFVSLVAADRLLQFRKEFAILENLIPHPMIASYLGVTNVSLSRLRSALLKA